MGREKCAAEGMQGFCKISGGNILPADSHRGREDIEQPCLCAGILQTASGNGTYYLCISLYQRDGAECTGIP